LGGVGGAELVDGLPGDGDLVVAGVGGERGVDAGLLLLREVLEPEPQDGADPVQRVALAAAVAVDGLLDPAADLIQRLHAEVRSARGAVTALPSVPFPRAASRTGRAACTAPGSPRARAEGRSLGDLGESGPAGGDDAAVSVAGDRHRCRVK